MIKIKATFIGTYSEKVQQYIPNQEYELSMTSHHGGKLIITIFGTPYGYCPYDSFIIFLLNWTDIKTHNI